MNLFIAYLKIIKKKKKDFNTFLSNNDAEISTNKAFWDDNLDFNKIDKPNSNNEDCKDFFLILYKRRNY